MGTQPRIIKAEQTGGLRLTPFNAVDTLAETEKRVQAAREEVERFQEAALKESKERFEKAQKEGLEKGYAEGLARGTAEAAAKFQKELLEAVREQVEERSASVAAALAELTRSISAARDEWLAQWEQWAIELSCAVAERVVRHEVEKPNDTIRKIVAETLHMLGRCPSLTIYLHPSEVETIDMDREHWHSLMRAIGEVKVVADEGLSRGGCRLETEFGAIDADVQTQLARIERELTGKEEGSGTSS
jgi:flagellar assembly protein FliH